METPTAKIIKYAEAVNESIKSFLTEESRILSMFKSYDDALGRLLALEATIRNFKKVESEVAEIMMNYDFSRPLDLKPVIDHCGKLNEILIIVSKISKESESLSKLPGRYGICTELDKCKSLSQYIAESMGLKEIEKVLSTATSQLNKLRQIRITFDEECRVDKEIKNFISQNKNLLLNYTALYDNLMILCNRFPKEPVADITYVKSRIVKLRDLDVLFKNLKVMVQEVTQKLSPRAESRFGADTELDECNRLLQYCTNTMSHDEVEAMTLKISNRLKSVEKIKIEIQKDDAVHGEIVRLINHNSTLLSNYPAFNKELNSKFVLNIPDNRDSAINEVQCRINNLKAINELFVQLQSSVSDISRYANRFGVKAVCTNAQMIISKGKPSLTYSVFPKAKGLISKTLSEISIIKSSFDKEQQDAEAFFKSLSRGCPELWREDVQSLCTQLKSILDRGIRYLDFDMSVFVNRRNLAEQQRFDDIEKKVRQKPWLKRDRYKEDLDRLKNKSLTRSQFMEAIADIESGRGWITKLYELIMY